ncbi:hypothetical protein HBI74_147580 [Parastagonospora nodorum]|nr:hypothetical protein HBI74_147580 [Parastagonospora nodorum]
MMIADVMALVRQRTAQMHELESQSEWRITGTTWTQAHTKPSSLKNITKTPSSSDSIWNGTLSRLGLLANSQGKLRSSMDEA